MLAIGTRCKLRSFELTCRDIRYRHAELGTYTVDAHKIVTASVMIRSHKISSSSGCQDVNDAALYETFCCRRIFKLLADGDLVP